MSEITHTSIQKQAREIADLLRSGIESWKLAGERLCAIIDSDSNGFEKVCQAIPDISPNILCQLERIGRSQLVPELLLKNGPGAKRAMRLSYSQQRRVISQPIDVLVVNGGQVQTLKVELESMTPKQARQVFTNNGIRDVAAQRAWLASEQRETLPEVKESAKPYSVNGRVLTITKPCRLSISDLGIILAEMKN